MRVCLITGASSGIGKALAMEFAALGFNLFLFARNEKELQNVCAICETKNSSAKYLVGDVTNENDCKNFIQYALDHYGRIDILVNNAGISMRAIFANTDLQVIKKLMDTNFWGTVYCTKYALQSVIKNNGSIVGISSIAGFAGLPGRTGYSASKFAMQGFLESLRCENIPNKLHVLIACPGYTASNIRNTALNYSGKSQNETPLNEEKLMSAETVAKKIISAIEKRKSYLVLTTQGKIAVWLHKFFPLWLDKILFNKIKKEADSPF